MSTAASRHSLEGVQVLRALAAVAVLLHHTLEISQPIIAPAGFLDDGLLHAVVLMGASGVDLFFVLSGFIMLHTNWNQFERSGAPASFLRRRILRIAPLYWLCTSLVLLAKWGGQYKNLDTSPLVIFNSIFLLPSASHVVGVAWTLVFEMYFYYLFACWLTARRRVAVVGIFCSLLAVWAFARGVLPVGSFRTYLGNPIAIEFAFGMGLAWAYRVGWRLPYTPVAIVAAAAIAWAALVLPSDGTAALSNNVRFWAWGVPAAILVAVSLRELHFRSRSMRLLVGLGDASYALYLTHALFMTGFARVLKVDALAHIVPPALWIAVVMIVCIATAWIVHRSIEVNLLKWLSPLSAGNRPVSNGTVRLRQ